MGRKTQHDMQRRQLRHDLHDVASIKWGVTREHREAEPEEPWEVVRRELHYAIDDSERMYNQVIEEIKMQNVRRADIEDSVAEESVELEELQRAKIGLDSDIQTQSAKHDTLSKAVISRTAVLQEDNILVEQLKEELAKAKEAKAGFRARLVDLDERSAASRSHWKSEKAKADREIRDRKERDSTYERDLANLKDKLAVALARAKGAHDHYDTRVAQLEENVVKIKAELEEASAAKIAAVNAFTEQREKWQQSHRENRAMERKMAEQRKSLEVQSQDLATQMQELHQQQHRKSRTSGVGSQLPGVASARG